MRQIIELLFIAGTILLAAWCGTARADTLPTLYLDRVAGNDENPGTYDSPVATWPRMVSLGCFDDSVQLVYYEAAKPDPNFAMMLIRTKSDADFEEVMGDVGGVTLMTAYYIYQSRMANCRIYRVVIYATDEAGNIYAEDEDEYVEIY